MFLTRVSVFVICVVSAFATMAQSDDKTAEKQRKLDVLVSQINDDAADLKLTENRAFVYAKLGGIACRRDAAAGRALFEKAVAELVAAQSEAESSRKSSRQQYDQFVNQNIRPRILHLIASYDAELALDALIRTRPAIVAEALRFQPAKNQKISSYSNGNYSYVADNERNLEQTFTRMAAEQKPERAAKLIKDALKKNITNETLNLLKKLHEKDPTAANSFANEIADRLIRGKFETAAGQPDNTSINVAMGFVSDYIRERQPNEKSIEFDAGQMRVLADRLIAFYLDKGQNYGYYNVQIVTIAQKLAPASVAELKQIRPNYRNGFDTYSYDPDVQKVMQSDATVEQLLALTQKIPANMHSMIYDRAARKIAQSGDTAAARSFVEDHFDGDMLENELQQLDWQEANNLQSAGRFDEAERIIDQMPDAARIGALVNLANYAYNQDVVKNATYAAAVIGKARQAIGERAENQTEMSNLLQIVAAYSRIEPRYACAEMETIVPQINEITNAAVTMQQYQGGGNTRQGEAVIVNGFNFGVYFDFSALPTLAKLDLERTLNIINTFARPETRILLRLQLAESGLE